MSDIAARTCTDANDQDITSVFYDVLDFIEVLTVSQILDIGSHRWAGPQMIAEGHHQHDLFV